MSTDDQMVKNIFGGDTGGAAPNNEPENEPTGDEPGAPDNPDTPEGQEPGSEPGGSEPGGEPGTEPKLYAGKYKTVEELEAAYKEAERSFHSDRQERAELKRQLDELKAALEPKKPDVDPKQQREQLLERLYEAPDEVIAELAEDIADKKVQEQLGPIMPIIQQQMINNQVQQFMSSVPDAEEYVNDMAAIVQNNPDMVNQDDWMEKAYMQAKIARLEANMNKVDNQQKNRVAAKQAAAMPTGTKGELQQPETEEEKLSKAIFGDHTGKRKMFDF